MREAWARDFADKAAAYWNDERTAELTKGKTLALLPGPAAVLLRALGLLHRDASMPAPQRRKYFQINHMLAVLGPSLRELMATHRHLVFVDAGCGRSYFTLLLAWHLRHVGHSAQVIGVDRNPALIDECRRRAEMADIAITYEAKALEDFAIDKVHGVVSLHACDTATDDALALAVARKAELIACAPCCQAELAKQWSQLTGPGAMQSIWATPHLRREIAASMTDAMRALLLRAAGYEVWPLEFVPSEHTPKNTLLRAMFRNTPSADARRAYDDLVAVSGGCGIGLAARI